MIDTHKAQLIAEQIAKEKEPLISFDIEIDWSGIIGVIEQCVIAYVVAHFVIKFW